MAKTLNPKQLLFVKHYLSSGNGSASAIAAGFSKANSYKRAMILLKNPLVMAQIEKHRADLTEATKFGYLEAMGQAQEVYEHARQNGNSMAMAKACELRSKLSGLLIERHQVSQASFTVVIERNENPANENLSNVIPILSSKHDIEPDDSNGGD